MPTSVFISYSHDSPEHSSFVRSIADRLRADGLNCQIDQYINGFPPEGWQRWMETQLEQADFVLLVCTETYLKRYRGQNSEGGRGVNFEGVVISQTLYDHFYRNTKFIPVIPDAGSLGHVPMPLKGYSTYSLPKDYTTLYRVLTDQHATPAPEIGETVSLDVLGNTQTDKQTTPKEKNKESDMTDTMKVAWIGGGFALLAAIITGLFALMGTPNITVQNSDCANINIGTTSGIVKQDCEKKDGE